MAGNTLLSLLLLGLGSLSTAQDTTTLGEGEVIASNLVGILGAAATTSLSAGSSTDTDPDAERVASIIGGLLASDASALQTISVAPNIGVLGDPSHVVVGSSTLTAGGPALTTNVQSEPLTLSVGPSGILHVDESSITIPSAPPPAGTDSITSTITNPPGVSVQTLGTQVTENMWTTTTDESSSTTVVPILVPCPGCDAVAVFDLPPIPDVEFNLPDLDLAFSLPCVAGCDTAPVNAKPPSGGSTEQDPPEDKPPEDTEDPDDQEEESCSSSSVATNYGVVCTKMEPESSSACHTATATPTTGCSVVGTTSTSWTTTGCETSAVPSCLVTCSPIPQSGAQPSSSSCTTACGTITACSGTTSTTTTTAPAVTIPADASFDTFDDSAKDNQVIMAIVASGMSSIDSIDAEADAATEATTGSTPEATGSSSETEPADAWPAPPVQQPGVKVCGVNDAVPYTQQQGGGLMEAGSGIELGKAKELVKKYCLQSDAADIGRRRLSQPIGVSDSATFLLQLQIPDAECAADTRISLGDDDETSEDYTHCFDTLMSIINDCDTDSTTAKKGGSLAIDCVVWSALSVDNYPGPVLPDESAATPPAPAEDAPPPSNQETPPTEEAWPPAPVASPGVTKCGALGNYADSQGGGTIMAGTGINMSDAQHSIERFCKSPALTSVLPLVDLAVNGYQDTDSIYWMQVVQRDDCSSITGLDGDGRNHDHCFDTLMDIVNGCDTDRVTEKIGGSHAEGCVIWTALSVSNWEGIEPVDYYEME